MLCFSCVKDFHNGGQKIKNKKNLKIPQTVSRLLFSESGAGNERKKEMPNRDGEGVESCGGGREWAADQYPHLKHLSVAR